MLKGDYMEYSSLFTSKTMQSIVFASSLAFSATSTVYGQSHNPGGESARESAARAQGSENRHDSISEEKAAAKKKSKQKNGNQPDAENYKGAQPPEGGRVGQGPAPASDTENAGK
jgi:hypothetical protein